VSHPDLGCLEYPDAPIPPGRVAGGVRRGGPRLGEHTAAVLREWLGCSASEVDGLRASGAIWFPADAPDVAPA
jgi:formyl-CoA transferase